MLWFPIKKYSILSIVASIFLLLFCRVEFSQILFYYKCCKDLKINKNYFMREKIKIGLFIISLLIFDFSIAQVGNLDVNFNVDDNIERLNINGTISEAEYFNGFIYISGTFTEVLGVPKNSIARLDTLGNLDLSFDCGNGAAGITGFKIQPDGKIYVFGTFTTFDGNACGRIVRLNSNGTFDNTFAPTSGANQSIVDLIIQNNGKIVVIGNFTNFNGVAKNKIVRLNSNGSLDNTFTNPTGTLNLSSIDITSTQKLLVGGTFTSYNGSGKNQMVVLNTNGTVDVSFTLPASIVNVYEIMFYNDNTFFVSYRNRTTHSCGFPCTYYRFQRRIGNFSANGTLSTFSEISNNCSGSFSNCGPCSGYYGQINIIKKLPNGNILVSGSDKGASRRVYDVNLTSVHTHDYIQSNSPIAVLPNNSYFYFNQTVYKAFNVPRIVKFTSLHEFDKNFYENTAFSQSPKINSADGNNFFGFSGNNAYFSQEHMGFKINENGEVNSSFNISHNNLYNNLWIDVNSNNRQDQIRDIKTISNNKTLVVYHYNRLSYSYCGSFYSGQQYVTLTRRDLSGNIEQTANFSWGDNSGAHKIYELNNGNVILYGTTINKINPSTFGTVSFNPGTATNSGMINKFIELKNGNYLIAGEFTSYNGNSVNKLALIYPNGSFNNSLVGAAQSSNYLDAIELSDGRIVLIGNITTYGLTSVNGIVVLNADGSIDNTIFNSTGFVGGHPTHLVQLPDDRFYAIGNFTQYNGTPVNGIVLINGDGTIDSSFSIVDSPNSPITSSLLLQNGDLILAGNFDKFGTTVRNKIARIGGAPFVSVETIGNSFCQNDSIEISVWVGGRFQASNSFSIELSDENGIFSNGTLIYNGNLNNGLHTIFHSTALLNSGTGYKIRIGSSLPNLMSLETDTFSISTNAAPSSIGVAGVPYCVGGVVYLSVQGGSLDIGANWEWTSGTCGGTAEGTGNTISVSPSSTTTYFVKAGQGTYCPASSCATITVEAANISTDLSVNNDSAPCYVEAGNWVHFYNSDGRLIASVNSMQDLGVVTTSSYINSSPHIVPTCFDLTNPLYQSAALARSFVITPTNPLTSGNTAQVRIYFSDAEWIDYLNAANNVTLSNPNDTPISLSDLQITKFSHNNPSSENGSPLDNCGNGTGTLIYNSSTGTDLSTVGLNGFSNSRYLQFTVDGFSEFYTMFNNFNSALPVTLTSFNANCLDNKTRISWTTASEIHSSHYILQASRDGTTWLHLAEIDAAGTTNQQSNYVYDDFKNVGVSFYRLVQVDLDGVQEVFGPITSNCEIESSHLSAFPNPIHESFTVLLETPLNFGNAEIELVDISGRLVLSQTIEVSAGSTMFNFDSNNLFPGTYIVRVKGMNDIFTPIRVVKI
jgi:uncharacterized delta-60 repeat protein